MKARYINTWKSKRLQSDKLEVVVRLFPLTVFALVADWSKKEIYISFFNFKYFLKF
jgi:hypothetical protein